jgi:hypothetical protein
MNGQKLRQLPVRTSHRHGAPALCMWEVLYERVKIGEVCCACGCGRKPPVGVRSPAPQSPLLSAELSDVSRVQPLSIIYFLVIKCHGRFDALSNYLDREFIEGDAIVWKVQSVSHQTYLVT